VNVYINTTSGVGTNFGVGDRRGEARRAKTWGGAASPLRKEAAEGFGFLAYVPPDLPLLASQWVLQTVCIGTEIRGVGFWGLGSQPRPHLLGGLGERCKLPRRGPGRSPIRRRVFLHCMPPDCLSLLVLTYLYIFAAICVTAGAWLIHLTVS